MPYAPGMEDGRLEAEVKELVCYLWDNYIQLYDAHEVFIMGVGYAYIGIKMLLLNRSEASPPGNSLLFWSPPYQTTTCHSLMPRPPSSSPKTL